MSTSGKEADPRLRAVAGPAWSWPASFVTQVIDGDSMRARLTRTANVDYGFGITSVVQGTSIQKLRLNRIDAYPLTTDRGKQARAFNLSVLEDPVLIDTYNSYKYGYEWMAEITLSGDSNLSDLLVAQGLAVYWNGTGPRPAV